MAWYAELKRRKWYCINGQNMIRWYRGYLYDLWWNSLTDEQKAIVEENRRKEKERSDRELRTHLMQMGIIAMAAGGMRFANKYNGLYDDFGFSRK